MAKYIYTARDAKSALQRGVITANGEDEAISLLQQKGLIVTFIAADTTSQTKQGKKQQERRFSSRLRLDDLILFGRQLATLLEAGVTLLRALDIITRQLDSKPLYEAVMDVKQAIEQGETLSRAIEKHPKIFTHFWVNLIETGEASGNLPISLNQLVRYLESTAALRRKLISAMIYPMILIGVSVGAITIFMTNIIPIFAEIFQGFDMELPFLTQCIIHVSNFLRSYFIYICIIAAAGVYGFIMYVRTKNGKKRLHTFLFSFPLFGNLMQQIAAARFSQGFSTLMKSGVPILHALEIVGKTASNVLVQEAITTVREEVRTGKSMAIPLEESGVFPLMVTQMIAVGEEIGELSKMLDRVTEFYEERIAVTVDRLTTLIEPLILIGMGAIIGVLVIAMFLPIFQISSISG